MSVGGRPIDVVAGALTALLLSGCGGLSSPVGDVSGRIVGATSAGYVYPLGRPDLVVPLEFDADGVGTYHLADVPNTVSAIVLYDGAPPPDGDVLTPDGRAELVPVHVTGGEVTTIADRYGALAVLSPVDEPLRMPLAGTLLAAAVPEGGATPWQPTFDLPQTVHAALVPATGGVYAVWPLPAGRFDVGASLQGFLPGFVGGDRAVFVLAGATTAGPIPLAVDLSQVAPGCAAVSAVSPTACDNGLVCEPADGRCYECTSLDTSRCGTKACVLETHLCEVPASASTYCTPCVQNGDGSTSCNTAGMICHVLSGTSGYCTTDACSSDADCPAGFDCSDSRVCRPPEGCSAWIQTMGAACYSDDRCHDALKNGWCAGDTDDVAGVCTAVCVDDTDCRVGTATNFKCVLPSGSSTRRCVAQ